jgi:hypothetical protein
VRQGTERGWRETAVATTAYPGDIIPERIIGMNNVPEPRMPRVENPRVPRSYGRYLVALYTTKSGRTLLWPRIYAYPPVQRFGIIATRPIRGGLHHHRCRL